MKSKFTAVAMLLAAIFSLASCLSDNDNDFVYTDDSAITSFSVQTAKQYIHTTTKAGKDSTITKTLSLTDYHFIIDQQKSEIYNPDSLPYGVDATKLLISASAASSGSVYLKSITSDSVRYVSSSDSLDFSQTRQLQVMSLSGNAIRSYTVRVNVHKEPADSFRWQRMTVSEAIMTLTATKLHALRSADGHSRVLMLGSNGRQTLVFASTDGSAWQQTTPDFNHTLAADAYLTAVVKNDSLYICDGNDIRRTADGYTWQTTGTSTAVTRLVAASPVRLYGYSADGKLLSSTDNGATWQTSTIDDDAALLPHGETTYATMALKTNTNAWRTVLIGYNSASADNYMQIWSKIDESAPHSVEQTWAYYTPSDYNLHKAPLLTNANAGIYGGLILLTGNDASGKAAFFSSRDCGITWERDSAATFPAGFDYTAACAMTVDADNFIWIVNPTTGTTWRGRVNSLGWKKEQYYFDE